MCRHIGINLCYFRNKLTKFLSTAGSLSTGNNGKTEVFQTVKHLKKIAERLDVSAEYLMNDEEYEITLRDKRNMFKKVTSLPQRWLSLHSGVDISKQQLVEIADYVNGFTVLSEQR